MRRLFPLICSISAVITLNSASHAQTGFPPTDKSLVDPDNVPGTAEDIAPAPNGVGADVEADPELAEDSVDPELNQFVVVGELVRLRRKRVTITHGPDGKVTYRLHPDVQVTISDKPAELEQLDRGDNVRIELDPATGRIARKISVVHAPGGEQNKLADKKAQTAPTAGEASEQRQAAKMEPISPFGWVLMEYRWGPIIVEIIPDTPAAESQLRVGDMITHINGSRVASAESFQDTMASIGRTKHILVTVIREDEKMAVRLPMPDISGTRKLMDQPGFYPSPAPREERGAADRDDRRRDPAAQGQPRRPRNPERERVRELEREVRQLRNQLEAAERRSNRNE